MRQITIRFMGVFEKIPLIPGDPIFTLSWAFKEDPRPHKQTFIIGYFFDENLRTPLLPSVSQVELELAEKKLSREYLPIEGDREYLFELGKIIFGSHWEKNHLGISAIHCIGGTGALFLGGLLCREHIAKKISIPDPTWINHPGIFKNAGLEVTNYPYYRERKIQFEEMLETFQRLPENTPILLQTSCHNPSGFDLTNKEWQELEVIIAKKKLLPFFDMAYLGFGDEIDKDAYAPRYFLEKGHPFLLAFTGSKSFSLYGERVGALYVVSYSSKQANHILSQLKVYVRQNYSNPPKHGAMIVKEILRQEKFFKQWKEELKQMRERMQRMRKRLADVLSQREPKKDWDFIRKTKGLFCYSEIPASAIAKLREKYALYLAADSRMNVTGLNDQTIDYVSESIIEVLKK